MGLDVAGNPIKSTDPSGVVVRRSFDAHGQMISKQLGDLKASTVRYNARGEVVRRTDPDGFGTSDANYAEYSYDGAGNKITESAPVGPTGEPKTKRWSYDGSGYLLKTTDFKGIDTVFTTDAMGRVATVTLDHDGPNVTRYRYNAAGELTRTELPSVAAKAPITQDYSYDVMGRLETQRDGTGHITTFAYNLAGEQTSVADPRGYTLVYGYDGLGRQIMRRAEGASGDPVTSDESFSYDQAGNMTADGSIAGPVWR